MVLDIRNDKLTEDHTYPLKNNYNFVEVSSKLLSWINISLEIKYYYELYGSLSSCFRCDIYDQSGQKITWTSYEEAKDYKINRTDETIVWVYDM